MNNKIPFARQKVTVTTMCVMLVMLFAFISCKEKTEQELNDESFKNIEQSFDGDFISKNKIASYSEVNDKYDYPVKPGSPEWDMLDIHQRIEALQMPESVLATISTAGLLETCLDFPYLIEIHFGKNYQDGFEGLLRLLNGFRVLLKRSDLTYVVIKKCSSFVEDIEDIQTQSALNQGRFSLRHFVIDMILAQDAVIDNLSMEQLDGLVDLTLERTQIKNSYPEIFSSFSIFPSTLLYAKILVKNDLATEYMKKILTEFIQNPVIIRQDMLDYLDDYFNEKNRVSPGFSFVITNNTSYHLSGVFVRLKGIIGAEPSSSYLIASNQFDLLSGKSFNSGGFILTQPSGTAINSIQLSITATFSLFPYATINMNVSVDNGGPSASNSFSVHNGQNTFVLNLSPGTAISIFSRHILSVNIN